jgi:hypothetical protein
VPPRVPRWFAYPPDEILREDVNELVARRDRGELCRHVEREGTPDLTRRSGRWYRDGHARALDEPWPPCVAS